MKNKTNVAPWVIFGALSIGAFCSPWILPWAEAQRTGYVEKTASGAFANQLAPNPAAGLVLTPVGTDTSKVQWGTSGSGLPSGGAPGQVLGVATVTTTGTGVGTAWQPVNGTIFAGSNIAISKGTSTTMGTSATMPEIPKIHVSGVVRGSGSLSGPIYYLVKKGSDGNWTGSNVYENDSGYLVMTESTAVQIQANGSALLHMVGASDSPFARPQVLFNRKRGTLSKSTGIQAGDPLGAVEFGGTMADYSTAVGALFSSSASSLSGSNIVGSICEEVSDGNSNAPNVTVWCGTSSGFTVSVPITLSGLTGKGTGKVLYDTNGSGVIGEKTLAASDVGAEPALPAASQGKILGFATTTTTGTATSTKWDAVNGTIAVGTNLRVTKGTGTATNTSATMQEEPKINLDGFSGTTGVLSKKTADGWGDSCVSEGTNSVDSSKTIRVMGSQIPWSGKGLELSYNPSGDQGFISSVDRNTGDAKSLSILSSDTYFYINGGITFAIPTTAGTEGQILTKGSGNTSVWTTPAPSDGNDKVRAYSGQTPNYLDQVIVSTDSSLVLAESSGRMDFRANFGNGSKTVCEGNDSRLSNSRTPTAHASTHLTTGSDPISLASGSTNGLLSSTDYTALSNRTSTPTASRIPVANGSGYLSSWIPFTTTPGAGAFPKGDANGYLSGWIPFTTTPGNGAFPKGDSNGALTGWVKAFKDTATSACAADYSLTGNSWTTVASINCTLASAGKVFLQGLVKYQTTSSSWHYVGVKFILDSTDITESIRFTKTAKLIGSSYDYDSLSVAASATIANTYSHTCHLQFITGISSSDYVYCQGDATNQGAYITALKMYQ